MCGRYYVEPKEGAMDLGELIARILQREETLVQKMKLGEVFPTDIAPVLVADRDGIAQPQPMKWGFSRYDKKGVIINARSETAMNSPMFSQSMLQRRCLIPALYYFEWEKTGKNRIKYKIRPKGRGMITMAGIYRFERDLGAPVFAILTREAAPSIRFIHSRMPVIIPKNMRAAWLRGGDVNQMLRGAALDMHHETAS